MMKQIFFFCVFVTCVQGSGFLGKVATAIFGGADRPVKYEDTQPRLELRLSAPRHPLPEVSGKIELLDRGRKMLEEREMGKLIKSFDEEIKRSRRLITALIRKALEAFDDPIVIPKPRSSFYQLPWSHLHQGKIWISVEGSNPIDGTVLKRIESIEELNAKTEIEDFKAAVDDMHEVTRFTLQKLNETLTNILRPVINTNFDKATMYSSFIAFGAGEQRCMELQAKFGEHLVQCDDTATPHLHKITAFANEETYPTVESLVRDMLDRREVDEQLFQTRSLNLMAKLAQEQSKIIAETLQAAVATIKVQYADVIRATNMTREDIALYNRAHPQNLK